MNDLPPDPLPPEAPRDPDLIDYDALPTFDTRAFLWTVGLCGGMPLAGMLASSLWPLVLTPLAWLVALIYGLAALTSGQRALGKAVVLGTLVSAVVGAALCSGLAL